MGSLREKMLEEEHQNALRNIKILELVAKLEERLRKLEETIKQQENE